MHGECVIVGRGAAFILPVETTLRVRLVAPVKDRVLMFSETRHVSAEEAARRVRTIDRERIDFVHDHFQKNPTDPGQYDLILNAGRLTVEAEAGLVIDALCHLKTFAAEKWLESEQRRPEEKYGASVRNRLSRVTAGDEWTSRFGSRQI